MSEGNDQDAAKGRLSLRPAGRVEAGRPVDARTVRQGVSHGRFTVGQVEVRKNRSPTPLPVVPPPSAAAGAPNRSPNVAAKQPAGAGRALTANELAVRQRVLQGQQGENARGAAEG